MRRTFANIFLAFLVSSCAMAVGQPIERFEATRIFAGPSEFPPQDFAAYAILAFQSEPLSHEIPRYEMICEAYRTSIVAASEALEAGVPRDQQLVTVWPVNSDQRAAEIMVQPRATQCAAAVRDYGLRTAQDARRDATITDADAARVFNNRGPFLLAWSPAATKGEPDAVVLRVDLSRIETPQAAREIMEFWVRYIESDPSIWTNEWQPRPLRPVLRDAANRFGPGVFQFFGTFR